jgi:hypothetical protein
VWNELEHHGVQPARSLDRTGRLAAARGVDPAERDPDRQRRSAMRPPPGPDAPVPYQIRIGGHLDQHWAAWFAGMTLTNEPDGTTTLRGDVGDQAELHGLIAKVRDLGITLISVSAEDGRA